MFWPQLALRIPGIQKIIDVHRKTVNDKNKCAPLLLFARSLPNALCGDRRNGVSLLIKRGRKLERWGRGGARWKGRRADEAMYNSRHN